MVALVVTRSTKGAPLTNAELDANFSALDTAVQDKAAQSALDTLAGTVANKADTSALASYATTAAMNAAVSAAVANLVNASPASLDTLKELATALGNDANFSATMTAALAGKASQGALDALSTTVDGKASQASVDSLSATVAGLGSGGGVTQVTAAQLMSPTGAMLANLSTTYQRNTYPYDRWVSDGWKLRRIPDSLDDSAAFNPTSGRLEVSSALSMYQEGPTQGSKVISNKPRLFGGFTVSAQSAVNRITFWDSATGANGIKLAEQLTPAVGGVYLLDRPVQALIGIYMEIAAAGTATVNVMRQE